MIFANEGGGFNDPMAHLWQKINELETRVQHNEKIIQKIKGLKMGDEFNFDDLLSEIDETETKTVPEETKETKETQPEPKELDLDALLAEDEPEVTEPVLEVTEPVPETLESALEEVLEPTPVSTQPKPKVTKVQEISYDTVGVEFAEEYVKYWKELNDLELRKQAAMSAFKEELGTMKTEYEDAGVDIKSANYVRNTYIKQMRETTEESHLMEAIEKMMKADQNLKDSFIPFVVD